MKGTDAPDLLPAGTSEGLPPRGLTIPAAAHYMGVTPWLVEELVRSGKLPALRLCRNYTLLKEDLDAFLDSQPRVDPATFAAPPNDGRRWRKGNRQKERAA